MENEQINQESNDSVETQEVDAIETFANALESQESNDKPEVEDEQENEEVVTQDDEETESEEVEEESDEDELEATDEDDEDSDEVEEAQTFKVKANGEEQDVTLNELVEGYQKGSDYTKKSQHLAEQRKAVEEHAYAIQEAQNLRDEYHARLGQVQEVLQNKAKLTTHNNKLNLYRLKPNCYPKK